MSAPDFLPLVLIEAFAVGSHQGNGATVVGLDAPASAAWMQAVAASLRQSETAFVLPWADGWAIRWFTPTCEVKLCGHATLAATLALGHWGSLLPGESTRFQSRSGPLAVSLPLPGDGVTPASATIELPQSDLVPALPPAGLEELVHRHLGHGVEAYWGSPLGYSVALVAGEADLPSLQGFAEQLPEPCRPGLVVMQALNNSSAALAAIPALEGYPADYQLRFFAPGLGIPEDPVTGSAHALVAPYWQNTLGRGTVRGWQCSPQGGGMVCEGASGGLIRLRGPGKLLVDGRLRWDGQACDPESWAVLLNPESGR